MGGGLAEDRDPGKLGWGGHRAGGGGSPPTEPPGPPYFPWVSRTCGFGVRSCGCLDSELTEAWQGKCGFHLPAAQAGAWRRQDMRMAGTLLSTSPKSVARRRAG